MIKGKFNNKEVRSLKESKFNNDWIIAALHILVVHKSQHITSLFTDKENTPYSDIGKYKIKLYVSGGLKEIVVDDYFPCFQDADDEFYLLGVPFQYNSFTNQKAIWPMLIEKAIATEYGSYENLKNGTIDDAITLLTGVTIFRFNLLSEEVKMKIANGSLWIALQSYSDKPFLVGVLSLDKDMLPENNEGIAPYQVYFITDVIQCDSHKLIEMLSIEGEISWKGNWNPQSPIWTRRIREIITRHKVQKKKVKEQYERRFPLVRSPKCKTFYLSLKDLLKYFEAIFFQVYFDDTWEMQVIYDSWSIGRSGGSVMNLESVRYNPQYLLKVMQTTKLFFLLCQIWPYSNPGNTNVNHRITNDRI